MEPPLIQTLSKSRFLAGLQCPLRVWYQCRAPELATPPSPLQQALFDTGHAVGRLATGLYPGGLLIEEDYLHHQQAVRTTGAAMDGRLFPALYEAAFFQDQVRVRVDVLERSGDQAWNLVEVKSSTSVKAQYSDDLGVQYHVLCGSGLRVERACLLYINNAYVYDGRSLDLRSLFRLSDLTPRIRALQPRVLADLARLKDVVARDEPPAILPSRHCRNPHPCEFWEHCTGSIPEFWVMELPGVQEKTLRALRAMNVKSIPEIPASFRLSRLQERARACVVSGREHVEGSLGRELGRVEHPVFFLDFETVSPAVPRYAGTRPYQAIPFQWSCHTRSAGGELGHREYLCREDKDPREEFARALLEALGSRGTIFTYAGYEKRVVRELAEHLPMLRDRLLALPERFKDLHALLRGGYYHPALRGSFSLKAVLPAVAPGMAYDGLEIREGGQASLAYLRTLDPATPAKERERVRQDLLAYCRQDTLAMVVIRDELMQRAG